MYINLLPSDYVARQTLRRQTRIWAWILTVLIACGLLYCGRSLAKVLVLKRQITEQTLKHPGLRQMNVEISEWEQELSAARAANDAVDRLRNDKRALMLIGIVAQSLDKANGKSRLQNMSIRLPTSQDAAAPPPGRPAGPASQPTIADATKGSVTLDGIADDADTISRFVALLRQSGVLTEVNLKGSSETSTGSDRSRQFKIECIF